LRIQRENGRRDDKVHGAILASVDDERIENIPTLGQQRKGRVKTALHH